MRRPNRFRNTSKEKEYEYYVQDSNTEIKEAKKFYNEIDKEHLGIKSKYNNFFNCLVEEMRNRELLIPAIKKFYNTCFKINPNYGQKPLLEDAFNFVTFNLWSDSFDESEKKYILNSSPNIEDYFNKATMLARNDAELTRKTQHAHHEFVYFFDRGGYKNFYNRAEYNYEKTLPSFSNETLNLIKERYSNPRGNFDKELIMYWEDGSLYDLSPLGCYEITTGASNKDLNPLINKLKQVNINRIENEYQEFLKEQKNIFYEMVIVPLLKWKKGSTENLVQELRIKKHETTDGYIYILANKAFPNYIKIGSTMKDPRIRAHELTGTGVPFPYEVKFKILTKNCEILEKKVHTILDKKRVDLEREFFECSIEEAKKIIENVVKTGE